MRGVWGSAETRKSTSPSKLPKSLGSSSEGLSSLLCSGCWNLMGSVVGSDEIGALWLTIYRVASNGSILFNIAAPNRYYYGVRPH